MHCFFWLGDEAISDFLVIDRYIYIIVFLVNFSIKDIFIYHNVLLYIVVLK